VLLPPTFLLLASVLATSTVHRLVAGERAPLGRTAVLALLLFAAASSLRFFRQARGLLPAAALGVCGGVALVELARALLLEPALHPVAAAVACAVALASPPVWATLRRRMTEARVERVSVLAATDAAALEAVRRLESVPWLRVGSVLVPGTSARSVASLLWPADAAPPWGSARVERRVVVSCPVRTPAVGREIARLVARGHDITSESATLRLAEGRVDTTLADPLNLVMSLPRARGTEAASRAMDAAIAALLLILLSPLFLVVAVAILLEGGAPVFYRQRRVGAGGRTFDVVKFRSMRRDAEATTGPVWATEDDPRVTRVGRFLRHHRIDELPQLWNVLRGSMALVGPRPERPHFFEVLRGDVPLFDLRTIVRPGLTGWAQIRLAYGSSTADARTKLEYDLFYATRRSPWFDLAILFETVGVVLTRKGAR
jgi:exopolysaccharide biosynthesis polyprenyl glycosylphosphotransferase